jgi:heat shock protein HslJ
VAGSTESAENTPEDGAQALPGTAWAWQGTAYGNDTVVAPVDPTRYVIEFGTDGTVSVQDDCNQLDGVYSIADDVELIIELQTSTMAACAPESLHDQFVLDLSGIASYLFEEGRLYAALRYDTGIMEFAPAE